MPIRFIIALDLSAYHARYRGNFSISEVGNGYKLHLVREANVAFPDTVVEFRLGEPLFEKLEDGSTFKVNRMGMHLLMNSQKVSSKLMHCCDWIR